VRRDSSRGAVGNDTAPRRLSEAGRVVIHEGAGPCQGRSGRSGRSGPPLLPARPAGVLHRARPGGLEADPARRHQRSPGPQRCPHRQGPAPRPRSGRDGERAKRLTDGGDFAPRWSPDGSKIAFLRYGRAGVAGLYAIAANGTRLRRLAARGSRPAWSPDGSRIAYFKGHSAIGDLPDPPRWQRTHQAGRRAGRGVRAGVVPGRPQDCLRGLPPRPRLGHPPHQRRRKSRQRLTRDGGDEVSPVWSPDGTVAAGPRRSLIPPATPRSAAPGLTCSRAQARPSDPRNALHRSRADRPRPRAARCDHVRVSGELLVQEAGPQPVPLGVPARAQAPLSGPSAWAESCSRSM
jgi:hypothetical protein